MSPILNPAPVPSPSPPPRPQVCCHWAVAAYCQSAAAHSQVGSAVSLPGRILSPWKSHGVRMKQAPHCSSVLVPALNPVVPESSSEPAFLCGGPSFNKSPFLRSKGKRPQSRRRSHRHGPATQASSCPEKLGPPSLDVRNPQVPGVRRSPQVPPPPCLSVRLLVPSLGSWAAVCHRPGDPWAGNKWQNWQ